MDRDGLTVSRPHHADTLAHCECICQRRKTKKAEGFKRPPLRASLPSALSMRFYHFATPLSNQSCGGAGLRGDTRPFPQPSYRKFVSCQKFFDSFLLQLARGLVSDDASDEFHRELTATMVALDSRNACVAPRRGIVYHVLVTTERGANGEIPKLPAPFVFTRLFPRGV